MCFQIQEDGFTLKNENLYPATANSVGWKSREHHRRNVKILITLITVKLKSDRDLFYKIEKFGNLNTKIQPGWYFWEEIHF